jgi:hypothetical protein
MKGWLVFSLMVLTSLVVFSQHQYGLEYRTKIGFLAAHRGTMGHLAQEHSFAGELSFFVEPKGNKFWHSSYRYPKLGGTLFFGSVGNPDILGNYGGIYGFMEFPFVAKKFYRFYGKLSSGLGFTNKVYDPITNPKNVAMSSYVNALVCLGIKNEFRFKTSYISLGLDLTHFSNGANKVPNLGINLPYLSLGFGHVLRTKNIGNEQALTASNKKFEIMEMSPVITPRKKWLYGVTGIVSMKEIFPTDGPKYGVFAVNFHTRMLSRPKVGVELGLDVISKQAILGYKPEIPKSQWDILQMGLYAAYLLPLDQFHFVLGMGAYIKDKYKPEDPMYHRIGMRYYFQNGINAQIQLKTHWARADYVEWGLGYTFNYKQKQR